jgi:hypothetical protein
VVLVMEPRALCMLGSEQHSQTNPPLPPIKNLKFIFPGPTQTY